MFFREYHIYFTLYNLNSRLKRNPLCPLAASVLWIFWRWRCSRSWCGCNSGTRERFPWIDGKSSV